MDTVAPIGLTALTDNMAATDKPVINWEQIQIDYRAGVKPLREIAEENGISHAAIGKRARRDGWDRDLSARIQAKADALVSKGEVSKEVAAERLVTEKQVVEINAQAVAAVRIAHRRDIARSRTHLAKLLTELEDMEKIEDAKAKPTLAIRAALMKTISETQKTLISLERESWGIKNSDEGQTPQTITKILREIVRPA